MAATQQMSPGGPPGRGPVGRGVIAVVGEADPIARSVEAALQPEHFTFEYHRSPGELLERSCERSDPSLRFTYSRAEAPPSPALFLFNLWDSPRTKTGSGLPRWRAQCLEVMGELDKRCPRTPILVVADELRQRRLIEDALDRGADEVIGTAVAAISPLVLMRVRTVLESFALRYGTESMEAPAPTSAIATGEATGALARLRRAGESLQTPEDRAAPLADLLGVSVPGLRAESGRLDAKRIAAQFGVSLSQLAKATPVSRQALSETPDSPRAQAALDPFARTWGALSAVIPADQILKWLNARHERLDGSTPLEALLDGRAERVARLVESVRNGGVA